MQTSSAADESGHWADWALSQATAMELAAWYHRSRPRVIVEAGSGWSTVVAAEYAARSGATVISLEHERRYADQTTRNLADRGLTDRVDLRHVNLAEINTPTGPAWWYDTRMPDRIEFALVDGPPGSVGRRGAMYALRPHLADQWHMWLDDADRDGEQDAIIEWREHLAPVHVRHAKLPHGVALLSPDPPGDVDASDTIVTILTGGRPRLLADTIGHIVEGAPGLLETAHVIVHINGADTATREIIDSCGFVDTTIRATSGMTMGESVSALADRLPDVAGAAGARYWLHLEDDWRLVTATPATRWLGDAKRALDIRNEDGERTVRQVRLRHRSEAVHTTNMGNRRAAPWYRVSRGSDSDHPGVPYVSRGHYTCNPSLMMVEDAAVPWPAPGENSAIRRYNASGALVAQLDPGVFVHTGGSHSLERPLGGRRTARGRRRGTRR